MIQRTNRDWNTRLKETMQTEFPIKVENAMLRVEGKAKEIVYLGRPDHLIRRTGTLQRSITTEVEVTEHLVTANTGTNVEYAPTHEFGDTREQGNVVVHVPPRPFLMPAWVEKKDEVKRLIQSSYSQILRSVRAK